MIELIWETIVEKIDSTGAVIELIWETIVEKIDSTFAMIKNAILFLPRHCYYRIKGSK